MESIINGLIAILSLCVTAAILWYGIRFLKAQTELTELKMEKIKKEMDVLEVYLSSETKPPIIIVPQS